MARGHSQRRTLFPSIKGDQPSLSQDQPARPTPKNSWPQPSVRAITLFNTGAIAPPFIKAGKTRGSGILSITTISFNTSLENVAQANLLATGVALPIPPGRSPSLSQHPLRTTKQPHHNGKHALSHITPAHPVTPLPAAILPLLFSAFIIPFIRPTNTIHLTAEWERDNHCESLYI